MQQACFHGYIVTVIEPERISITHVSSILLSSDSIQIIPVPDSVRCVLLKALTFPVNGSVVSVGLNTP